MKNTKIGDVDLSKIYYTVSSKKNSLSIVVPVSVRESAYTGNYFWTEAYLFFVANSRWFYFSGRYIFGNKTFMDTSKRLTKQQEYLCIQKLFKEF